MGWAGLMALVGTLAAHAQAVVPQYTHRGFVGTVAFDDDDERVAVTSSGGFVSVIDVASGRVLAVRRLVRSNDSGFIDVELDGPVLRALVTAAGDLPSPIEWNWVDDTTEPSPERPTGWMATRGPGGRLAEIDEEGDLRVGSRRTAIDGEVTDMSFPHARVLVLRRRDGLELRAVRDPARVVASLPGEGMSLDGSRRVATVDAEAIHIATLPRGAVTTVAHGLGASAAHVVFGGRTLAVVGRDRSELQRRGQAPVTLDGAVIWIGQRSMIVKRGSALVRVRLRDLDERPMVADGADQAWVGDHGVVVFRNDEMDRFTLVRRDGSRRRYESGGEHSVWHVHAAPSGESVVLAGRFGVQRWTRDGVVDGECDGENLLAIDWERGLSYSRYGRCTRRGTRESYPNDQEAVAASPAGTTLLLGDGRFFGPARPRARVRDLPRLECEDYGFCNWRARFVANGELIVVEMDAEWGAEGAESRVIRTRTGRDVFRVPAGRPIEVSTDGSRFAILHRGGGSVRDARGTELFTFGSAEPDDDAPMPLVTFSADGRRLAWLASAESLEVLDPEGRVEQRVAVDGRPSFLLLTADGIAHGNHHGTVIRIGALTHHEAAGVTPSGAACVQGHFRSLEPDLRVVRGPACTDGSAERRGELYFRKMGGAVRVWHHGRVMTLRTIRRGRRTTPMAYTTDGRWWTRAGSAEAAAEAPFALRQGLASAPVDRPADPELLGVLFGD